MQPTEEQHAVITHPGGNVLVSAVAGAGKTATMVERVAFLLHHEVEADEILVLMFNKAAQVQFDQRTRTRLRGRPAPAIRTFHALGYAMTKRLVEVGALRPAKLSVSSATVERLARVALRAAWQRANGKDSFPPAEIASAFLNFITRVKAGVQDAATVFRVRDYRPDMRPFVEAFEDFERRRESEGIITFDCLLYRTIMCLREKPELWTLFQGKYREIIVDEFQDVNDVQMEMLIGIAGDTAHVMAIGDPDQAIYSWRGSSVDWILTGFEKHFQPCQRLPMTRTFRYGHATALAASMLIAHNLERDDKITVAAPGNPDTHIRRLPQHPKTRSALVKELKALHDVGELGTAAMLVRYYSQSVVHELEMAAEGIPFHVYGRSPLLLLQEIACLVAVLSLATDHWTIDPDLVPHFLQSLLATPTMYLSREDNSKLVEEMMALREEGRTDLQQPLERMAQACRTSNAQLSRRLRDRADAISIMTRGTMAKNPPKAILGTYMAITGMLDQIERAAATKEQGQETRANVAAFVELASSHDDAIALLDLLGPMAAHKENEPPQTPHLAVMSVHRAKGLEFERVYLAGWGAGAFPRESMDDIEEERRLAYVAITRAINELVFMHPDDDALDKMLRELTHVPLTGEGRAASPFLYEAEIGLASALANLLANGQGGKLQGRDIRIAQRYLQAVGADNIELSVPESVKAVAGRRPLTDGAVLPDGTRLWHPVHGSCVVQRLLYKPAYLLKRVKDGEVFNDVVQPNQQWRFDS